MDRRAFLMLSLAALVGCGLEGGDNTPVQVEEERIFLGVPKFELMGLDERALRTARPDSKRQAVLWGDEAPAYEEELGSAFFNKARYHIGVDSSKDVVNAVELFITSGREILVYDSLVRSYGEPELIPDGDRPFNRRLHKWEIPEGEIYFYLSGREVWQVYLFPPMGPVN